MADPVPQAQRHQPAALSERERALIPQILCRQEYADQSVRQTYWRSFDADLIDCSESTFYRVARKAGLVGDRRRLRADGGGQRPRRKPIVAAGAPGQLWSWDVTELRGPGQQRYKLALVIDVFSRYPVCWHVDHGEDRREIIAMFAQAFALFGEPDVVHSDNGPVMRSHELVKALLDQGVTPSYSRPRVSDDNPFSESLFKTIKYDLACPQRFDSLEHTRTWVAAFMHRYANDHRHSGLGHYTPAAVFHGTAQHDHAHRQQRLDQAYAQHPERFRKPPKASALPGPTGINTKTQAALSQTA
ncbi:transposase [Gordonia sp. (in: high G+C Gram-positive bacteria)]|uniref:transposase n=1 Tax=Gordonia sp. (in: high G+C Gram-positive bacteria) TaxID=84139 RepID=UPI00391D156D